VLLGLDLGTSSIKAILVDATGEERAAASVATPFTASDGRVEVPVERFRAAVAEVLEGLEPRSEVVAVGIAGMAESGAAFDGDGRSVSPVIAWNDERGGDVVDRVVERFGDGLAVRIGQPLRTVSSVAKLGWLAKEREAACWLGVPELALHSLTGAAATEHSLAARTGCYDVGERAWMPEVAEAAGVAVGVGVFPLVRAAGTSMGRVSAAGAGWSGLPEGVPVTIAGHDHLAGMVGAGVGAGDLANSVGTAETVVGRVGRCPDRVRTLGLRVAVTVFPGGREWAVLASAVRAGLVVGRAAAALGRSPSDLDRLALELQAGPGGPGALAGLDAGGLIPELVAGRPVRFPQGEPGPVWAAVLDALAERTRDAAERVAEAVGGVRRVVVFGGGSRSRPWLEAKARVLPVPLWRSAVPDAVARGAALFAGVAAGWWASPDAAPAPPLEPVAH
jgi:xylulokinase